MSDVVKEKMKIAVWMALPPALLGGFIILAGVFSGSKIEVRSITAFCIETGLIFILGFLASPLFSDTPYQTDTRDPRSINGERFAKKFFCGMLIGFLFSLASCYIYTFYDREWQKGGMAFVVVGFMVIVITTGFYSLWPFTLGLFGRIAKRKA